MRAAHQRKEDFALLFGEGGRPGFVRIPESSSLALGKHLTLTFWIQTTSTYGGEAWHDADWLIDKDIPGEVQPDWAVVLRHGRIVFNNGNPTGTADQPLFGQRVVNDGQWHHVAITRDASSGRTRIYIDGKLDAEGVFSRAELGNTEPLQLGFESNPDGLAPNERAFEGVLDELRIWTKVRGSSELREDMEDSRPGCQERLAGAWSFNEGSGQETDDLGPRDADGQLGALPTPDEADPRWVRSSRSGPPGSCGGATRVKDIYPGPTGSTREITGQAPSEYDFVELDGVLLFMADDGRHGFELWKTDGRTGGTGLVKDIWPGPLGGIFEVTSAFLDTPQRFVRFGDAVYFTANDGVHGLELWKTDGTAEGTVMVKDIGPGAEPGFVNFLTPLGDSLYFSASDETHGLELWKTDGTTEGTVMVKDVIPGLESSLAGSLTAAGGRLFFNVPARFHELWVSDGTPEGTVQVPGLLDTSSLTPLGDVLFLSASGSPGEGAELWRTDGTAAGTRRVADIFPGVEGSSPHELTAVGGVLFFAARDPEHGDELWRTEDAGEGASLVKDIHPGPDDSGIRWGTAVDGMLFFSADDGRRGVELWKSAGTASSTRLVKDIARGSASSSPERLTAIAGVLVFSATDGAHGREPWTSAGTEKSTRQLDDIRPGRGASEPKDFTRLGSQVLFSADDGRTGGELWSLPVSALRCPGR
ncbi:ELWxxDGT repeat protein [Archangium violaceum]|uniref:ELWxxDGT repeat protein n=1 Tax=Archangium violaceum TaxID=83451 RepID=UPI0006972882|nr:ELWxxDGT repeat protein [Archangium violaceum]